MLPVRAESIKGLPVYKGKRKYRGLEVSASRWLQQLEEENRRLKQIVAGLRLHPQASKTGLADLRSVRQEIEL